MVGVNGWGGGKWVGWGCGPAGRQSQVGGWASRRRRPAPLAYACTSLLAHQPHVCARFFACCHTGKEEEQATAQARWRDARWSVQLLDRFPLLYRALSRLAGDVWGPLLMFVFSFCVVTVVAVVLILCGLIS